MKRYRGPAIASFFVIGLGQIFKEETELGLKLLLTFYFAIPLLLVVLMHLSGLLFLIFFSLCVVSYPIAWAYSIWDAYRRQI